MAKLNSEKRNIHMLEKKKRVWYDALLLFFTDLTQQLLLPLKISNVLTLNAKFN